MLSPYLQEQLVVLRRIADRGMNHCHTAMFHTTQGPAVEAQTASGWARSHVDLWQHMIDELERTIANAS
jgi:hypothetical protein